MRYWLALLLYASSSLLTNWWGGAALSLAQTSQSQQAQISQQSNREFIAPTQWESRLSWSTSKNMDNYSDYFTSFNSHFSYGFNKDLSLDIGFGYSQPINDNEEKVRRYGFQDISTTVSFYNLNSSKLNGFVSLVLPTSRVSQKASLMTSLKMGLNYSARWKKLGFETSNALILSHYRYDTADEFGYIPNAPYGLNNSVTGTLHIHPRLSLSIGGGIYFYQTYMNKNRQVNSLTSSAQFLVARNWGIAASYHWRDTLVTNNSFLDDDTTVASLSTSYSF